MMTAKENEIHQCTMLKHNGRYLQYCCSNRGNARWRLVHAQHGDPGEHDMVEMQIVLFCPCCGQDFRRDTGADHVGRPRLNEILKSHSI